MSQQQLPNRSQSQNGHAIEVGVVDLSFSKPQTHRNGDRTEPLTNSFTIGEVGMVLQLADGRVQSCNRAVEKILGFTLAQMQDTHYVDWPWQTIRQDGSPFPVDRHPTMVALQSGQPILAEIMGLFRPDGTLVWLQVDAHPLFQHDPTSHSGVCTTFTPLAERNLPQQSSEMRPLQGRENLLQQDIVAAEKDNQAVYELLGGAIPAILFINDSEGQCSYVNPKFYDYTGQAAGSAKGGGWTQALHPDDQERIQQEWLAAIAQGKPFEVEYRFRQFDGAYRWFVGRSSPIHDSTGDVHHWLGICVDVHDLKLSQEELQCSEARFRRVADANVFGVAIGDLSGRMHYANDSLLNMIGYSRAELEAGHIRWIDLTPPEYLHLDWQAAEEMRQRGVATPFEKEYIHKDGHRVPILIGGGLLDEPYAEQELVMGFYVDLSKLKQTEHSLKEALQKLNSHVENTPMAVIEWDANLMIRRWSGAAPQIFGWSAEEIVGTDLSDLNFVYEEDIPHVTAVTQRILSGTEPQTISQNRNYTKDGSILHCFWYNSTLTDATGQVTSVLSLVLDVTEQVQAEDRLRQSEERFRLAARAVAGMVYDWNVATGEVYRSEGMLQLMGLPPETVPPTLEWWAEQIHPDDLQWLNPYWQSVLAGNGDHYDAEFRVRHHEGHWIHIRDQGYVIRDRQGQVIRVVGSSTDITARKQFEQEREQLLRREQAAREQAEALSRMKDEFLAAISHELRTPLNPILGWAKLLQTRPFQPEQTKQALAAIERNAKLQTQLIDDLLDISRVMQGKLTLNRVPVDLAAMIMAALKTVQPAAEAKSITLQTTLNSTLKPVLGDATRLQQVVWNLLSNAIKFTPSGGQVDIRLSLVSGFDVSAQPNGDSSVGGNPGHRTKDTGLTTNYAQIIVSDTGIGIAPEFLPHVFEHFRQQDGATTRKFGGLGLGLTIVKQIIELHGGAIAAHSAGIGQGATFIVNLPLLQRDTPENVVPECSPALPSPSPSLLLAGLHILVVEDDADSQDYLASLLEQEQAQVMVANSASEALQILSQCQPDILLSDIGLPRMSGYDLMQRIRSELNLTQEQLPAIALTAYVGEYDQEQALVAGFQRHLAKPVEPEALIQAIAALVVPSASLP